MSVCVFERSCIFWTDITWGLWRREQKRASAPWVGAVDGDVDCVTISLLLEMGDIDGQLTMMRNIMLTSPHSRDALLNMVFLMLQLLYRRAGRFVPGVSSIGYALELDHVAERGVVVERILEEDFAIVGVVCVERRLGCCLRRYIDRLRSTRSGC